LSAELDLIDVAECKDFTDIFNLKIQKTLLLYMEILANISLDNRISHYMSQRGVQSA